jgi:hypothetical protein
MIVLKPIIFYPDYAGCEATWVDRTQAPDVEHAEVPAVEATFDEEGNELTPAVDAIPAYTEAGAITDVQIKCHSYHPTQMDMLRADALELGTSLAEYNDQINGIEAHYVAPDPEPTPVPQVIKIRQAKLVLLAAGLLDDVDAAVAQADRATQIEWEYAAEVNRDWPTLIYLATSMGLSDTVLDGLFIEGAKL